jgi:NAD(P)-dependent dehydrogenase (short-subunit alcohol dehydrogenase family)
MKLNEMTVVITGANGTVASELISYFSNRTAFVVGTVRQLKENVENENNSAIIAMDPLDHYSIENAIKWVNSQAGDIHCWLNIIGGFTMGKHVEECHDDWSYMYNTNFMTALNCCQQILPKMKQNGWGRIVNMGTQAAVNGMPLTGPYSTSKAAVHMLSKIIALENGNGITCNALLPGIIDTPSNRNQMPDANHGNWVSPKQIAMRIETLLLSDENGSLINF